tara:strand:- start:85 stop:474 length:390 start_codon:yes stop_codon:yes gene_type:complete
MAYEYGKVKIQLRRDTASNLASKVLSSGEPAYATDTSTLKIGNGLTAFSGLSGLIAGGGGAGDITSVTAGSGLSGGGTVGALTINAELLSNTGVAGGGSVVTNIVSIASGAYAALGSKHPSTVYFVTGT